MTDVMEIIFLEMGKLEETKPVKEMSEIERWLYFLKYVEDEQKEHRIEEILEESEGIHMAMEI